MIHNEDYRSKILLNEDNIIMGYTKYDYYPIFSFENKDYFITIEGKIYNKETKMILQEILHIAELFSLKDSKIFQSLKTFILNSDGDYIVIIKDNNNNKIAIFNDVFGRLPFYYYKDHAIKKDLKIDFYSYICIYKI